MMLAEFEFLGNELGLLGRIWLTISRFEEGFLETFGQYSELGRGLTYLIAALHKSGYAAVRVQQICNKSGTLLKGPYPVAHHPKVKLTAAPLQNAYPSKHIYL